MFSHHSARPGAIIAIAALLATLFVWAPPSDAQSTEDGWIQVGDDIIRLRGDREFGWAVAVSADGSVIATSAPHFDDLRNEYGPGIVRTYEWTDAAWTPIGSGLEGSNSGDNFGSSIALSADGDVLAVSGDYEGVRVFERFGADWLQVGDSFDGGPVGINADGSAVTTRRAVYQRVGDGWEQLGSSMVDRLPADRLSRAVALSGDSSTIAVTAWNTNELIEEIRLFEWSDGDWQEVGQTFRGPDYSDGATFTGYSYWFDGPTLDESGSTFAFGAAATGPVRVFQRIGDDWSQVGADLDGVSPSISADGTTVLVGPTSEGNVYAHESGATHVYDLVGNEWVQIGGTVGVIEPGDRTTEARISADGTTAVLAASPADGAIRLRVMERTSLPTCEGRLATLVVPVGGAPFFGTTGSDVIVGTDGPDEIWGRTGDDIVCAGDGDDKVVGGQGDDRLIGEAGNDTLHGNLGADHLIGGDGNDRAFGYAGDDRIEGGPGDDALHGNFGNDDIEGGNGDDRIFGYGDDDWLNGNSGNDRVIGNFGDDLIYGGNGNDTLWGADGNDIVLGNAGNDQIYGNSGDDELVGGDDDDNLDGGIGEDECHGDRSNNRDTGGTNQFLRCERIR